MSITFPAGPIGNGRISGNGHTMIGAPAAPEVDTSKPIDESKFWPKPPETFEELGLIVPVVEDHLIRLLYFKQQATGSELAAGCGVPYVAVQDLIHGLARDHIIEVAGQQSLVQAGYRYSLAPKGRDRADEALRRTWYRGPLPVPLDKYIQSVHAQTVGELVIRRDALRHAF